MLNDIIKDIDKAKKFIFTSSTIPKQIPSSIITPLDDSCYNNLNSLSTNTNEILQKTEIDNLDNKEDVNNQSKKVNSHHSESSILVTSSVKIEPNEELNINQLKSKIPDLPDQLNNEAIQEEPLPEIKEDDKLKSSSLSSSINPNNLIDTNIHPEEIPKIQNQETGNIIKNEDININYSLVKSPNNYLSQDEKISLDFLNAVDGIEWKEIINDKDSITKLQMFLKIFDDGSVATRRIMYLPYPINIVKKCFLDDEIKKKWEEDHSKSEKVLFEMSEKDNIKIQKYYLFMKSPMLLISDRELLFSQKQWEPYDKKNNKHFLMYSKSIENDNFPIKDKPVRIIMEKSAMYIQEINDNETMVVDAKKMNLKLPSGIMKVMSSKVGSKNKLTVEKICEVCYNLMNGENANEKEKEKEKDDESEDNDV